MTDGAGARFPTCSSQATRRGSPGRTPAEERGHLAALAVANALGRIDANAHRDEAAQARRAALRRALTGRAFLDARFRPADAYRVPRGDTIVCRCEEVTAQQVVDAVRIGCIGPNQVKAFLRCGMGPCQGRYCGITVTELIARERKVSPGEVGHFRARFPVKPITLGELASLPASPPRPSARSSAPRRMPDGWLLALEGAEQRSASIGTSDEAARKAAVCLRSEIRGADRDL